MTDVIASAETSLPTAKTLKERHPKWPPIKTSFFYSAHEDSPAKQSRLKESVKKADIILIEEASGPNFLIEALQKASDSKVSWFKSRRATIEKALAESDVAESGSEYENLFRLVYGTGKVIGLVDTTEDQFLADQKAFNEIAEERALSLDGLGAGDFDKVLSAYADSFTKSAHLHRRREKIMGGKFEAEMDRIMRQYPKRFNQKKPVNVLFELGAYHTQLSHDFAQAGFDVDREFFPSPYIYSYRVQAERTAAFGKPLTKDLLAKVYLENQFLNALQQNPNGTVFTHTDTVPYLRDITSIFTLEEIQGIFAQLASRNETLSQERANTLLRDKGLPPLPTTTSELHALLPRETTVKHLQRRPTT